MNTCGWIIFIAAIVDTAIRLVYTSEGMENIIKPSWVGVVLSIVMCIVVWHAVHP